MQKRGLSELIATILIVLIVLVGVGITWTFMRGSLEQTSGELASKINCIDIELEPKKCEIFGSNVSAHLTVQVKKGSVDGFIGVVELADGSRVVAQLNETLEVFSTRTVSIALGGGQAVRGSVAALLRNERGVLENCDLSGVSVACAVPSAGSPECTGASDCDDSNPCTLDQCNSGSCSNPAVGDGTSCDDGLWCSTTSQCGGGVCRGVTNTCDGGSFPNIKCNESTRQCDCSLDGFPEDSYCLPPSTICDPILLICVPGPGV